MKMTRFANTEKFKAKELGAIDNAWRQKKKFHDLYINNEEYKEKLNLKKKLRKIEGKRKRQEFE